ncbi:MAG: phage tail tape measure protein [Actinomycetia bacterium]|nr:phage tail tape measure protein [Actinomycetes bacterium]
MSEQISYKFSAIDGVTKIASKISKGVKKVTDKLKKLGRQSKETESKFKKSLRGMKGSMSGLVSKMQGVAVGMLAAFGMKKVLDAGMAFEDAMVSVSQITGATGEQLDFYSNKVQEVARKHGIASSEIAVALKDIASGKSELLETPAALVKITDKAAELSRATGIMVPESVKAMIGSLNMFQKGAEHVGKFSDILVKGAQVGASEVGQTAEALKNVGNIAASNNISFLETNALLQAMSKANLKGAEAGTGLAGILRFIKKKLPKLDVKKMGISNVLKEIMRLSDTGKLDLTKTFGEHEKSILALTANYGFLNTTIKDLNKLNNDTNVEAQKKMGSTRAKVDKLQVRMNQAMIKLFARLQPMLNKMLDDFERWTSSLTDADLRSFRIAVDSLVVALKLALDTVKTIAGLMGTTGRVAGEAAAAIVTGDRSQFSPETKALGATFNVMGGTSPGLALLGEFLSGSKESKMVIDTNVNLNNAPSGTTVESTKTNVRKSGSKSNMEKL